jgi:type IV secretion system protein VirD4
MPIVFAFILTLIFSYQIALIIQHGLNTSVWGDHIIKPVEWFSDLSTHMDPVRILKYYWNIMTAQSQAFPNGGWSLAPIIAFMPLFIAILLRFTSQPHATKRDVVGTFGSARFANEAERAAMAQGLELGIDPNTGHAIRIAVQGTLATIAPPRKGKTSGLLIPNLAYPELSAWGGPAVVIDSKGEVYRATHRRRTALGRRVICLDAIELVGGTDVWNPLLNRNLDDILYLQQTALALLPEASGNGDEAAAYFRNRAVDLITGAMIAVLRADRPSAVDVQRMLADEALFRQHLEPIKRHPVALAALEIIDSDPKTKDPIKSTALQAFQWLADARLRDLVSDNSFDFIELSRDEIDIFVIVPPEYKRVLAPLLRWFLSDLFTSIRRNRPEERVVIFIDEAAALGRFDELLTASTELPGYGASTWTLWQDRSQIVSLYGEAGASTLINTAEVVTISDLSAVDPAESDRWSKALGNYTGLIESFSRPSSGQGSATTNTTSQPAPLMSKEDLTTLPSSELLVFPNSGDHARHPLRLHKTVAHTDPRIRPFIEAVAPVGKAR